MCTSAERRVCVRDLDARHSTLERGADTDAILQYQVTKTSAHGHAYAFFHAYPPSLTSIRVVS